MEADVEFSKKSIVEMINNSDTNKQDKGFNSADINQEKSTSVLMLNPQNAPINSDTLNSVLVENCVSDEDTGSVLIIDDTSSEEGHTNVKVPFGTQPTEIQPDSFVQEAFNQKLESNTQISSVPPPIEGISSSICFFSGENQTIASTPSPAKSSKKFKAKKTPKSLASEGLLDMNDIEHLRTPFKYGWRREIVFRNTQDTGSKQRSLCDVYYFPPNGKKLRSMVDIANYLNKQNDSNVNLTHFTFKRMALFNSPEELVRNAGQSKRRPPDSSPQKEVSTKKITPDVLKKKLNSASPLSSKSSPKLLKKNLKTINITKKKLVESPKGTRAQKTSSSNAVTSSNSPRTTQNVTGISGVPFGVRLVPKQNRQKRKPLSPEWHPTSSDDSDSLESTSRTVEVLKGGVCAGQKAAEDEYMQTVYGTPSNLIASIVRQEPQKRHADANTNTEPATKLRILSTSSQMQQAPKQYVTQGRTFCSLACPGLLGIFPSRVCTSCKSLHHPQCSRPRDPKTSSLCFNCLRPAEQMIPTSLSLVLQTSSRVSIPQTKFSTSSNETLLSKQNQIILGKNAKSDKTLFLSQPAPNPHMKPMPVRASIPPPPPLSPCPWYGAHPPSVQYQRSLPPLLKPARPEAPFLVPNGQAASLPNPPSLQPSPPFLQPNPPFLQPSPLYLQACPQSQQPSPLYLQANPQSQLPSPVLTATTSEITTDLTSATSVNSRMSLKFGSEQSVTALKHPEISQMINSSRKNDALFYIKELDSNDSVHVNDTGQPGFNRTKVVLTEELTSSSVAEMQQNNNIVQRNNSMTQQNSSIMLKNNYCKTHFNSSKTQQNNGMLQQNNSIMQHNNYINRQTNSWTAVDHGSEVNVDHLKSNSLTSLLSGDEDDEFCPTVSFEQAPAENSIEQGPAETSSELGSHKLIIEKEIKKPEESTISPVMNNSDFMRGTSLKVSEDSTKLKEDNDPLLAASKASCIQHNQQETASNAQLLTLPSDVAKQLNLNEPIALKINGVELIVPPACIIHTPTEGVKILLRSGSFQLPINPSSKFKVSISKVNTPLPSNTLSDPDIAQSMPKLTPRKYLQSFRMLQSSFHIMSKIFEYLPTPSLLRARRVCKFWNIFIMNHYSWHSVHLAGVYIKNWMAAAEFLNKVKVKKLSLKGVYLSVNKEGLERAWDKIKESLPAITSLEQLTFGRAPASVLDALTLNMPNLLNLSATVIIERNPQSANRDNTPSTSLLINNMTEAVEAVTKGVLSASVAAKVYQVSEKDLKHLILKPKNIKITKEEEASILMCCLRLSRMGFTINLATVVAKCQEVLAIKYSSDETIPILANYCNDLFSQNAPLLLHDKTERNATLAQKLQVYYSSLRALYNNVGPKKILSPSQVLVFDVKTFKVKTCKPATIRLVNVTALSLLSASQKSFPVMLVFPTAVQSKHPELLIAQAKHGLATSQLVTRYLTTVLKDETNDPTVVLCNGNAALFSVSLLDYCMTHWVYLHCVPPDLAPYVFPGNLGGAMQILRDSVTESHFDIPMFMDALSQLLDRCKSEIANSTKRAMTACGLFPVNPKAPYQYQNVNKTLASSHTSMSTRSFLINTSTLSNVTQPHQLPEENCTNNSSIEEVGHNQRSLDSSIPKKQSTGNPASKKSNQNPASVTNKKLIIRKFLKVKKKKAILQVNKHVQRDLSEKIKSAKLFKKTKSIEHTGKSESMMSNQVHCNDLYISKPLLTSSPCVRSTVARTDEQKTERKTVITSQSKKRTPRRNTTPNCTLKESSGEESHHVDEIIDFVIAQSREEYDQKALQNEPSGQLPTPEVSKKSIQKKFDYTVQKTVRKKSKLDGSSKFLENIHKHTAIEIKSVSDTSIVLKAKQILDVPNSCKNKNMKDKDDAPDNTNDIECIKLQQVKEGSDNEDVGNNNSDREEKELSSDDPSKEESAGSLLDNRKKSKKHKRRKKRSWRYDDESENERSARSPVKDKRKKRKSKKKKSKSKKRGSPIIAVSPFKAHASKDKPVEKIAISEMNTLTHLQNVLFLDHDYVKKSENITDLKNNSQLEGDSQTPATASHFDNSKNGEPSEVDINQGEVKDSKVTEHSYSHEIDASTQESHSEKTENVNSSEEDSNDDSRSSCSSSSGSSGESSVDGSDVWSSGSGNKSSSASTTSDSSDSSNQSDSSSDQSTSHSKANRSKKNTLESARDSDSTSDDDESSDVEQSGDDADDNDEESEGEDDDSKCQMCMRAAPPHFKDKTINWVDCDGNCGRWFHVICIIRSQSKVDPNHYVCPSCKCKR